jgi:hypothetical protein
MPRRAFDATTAVDSASRCVEPQSRLMLRPFGDVPIVCTSKPRNRNSFGAIGTVAPFAQSTTMRDPVSGPAPFMISRRCWT